MSSGRLRRRIRGQGGGGASFAPLLSRDEFLRVSAELRLERLITGRVLLVHRLRNVTGSARQVFLGHVASPLSVVGETKHDRHDQERDADDREDALSLREQDLCAKNARRNRSSQLAISSDNSPS